MGPTGLGVPEAKPKGGGEIVWVYKGNAGGSDTFCSILPSQDLDWNSLNTGVVTVWH